MINSDTNKIEELLNRGVEEVIDKESLRKKLLSGKKLRIKLGIDPTSPNIHLGRTIPLLKLRDFQELGHKVVLIIGDFTGVIGDTSDKDAERPMLDTKVIKENMKNYAKQAGKIIDIKKCEVRHNSEWLKKLNYHEIGRQADNFSLNEFISRENIRKRLEQGKRISLRELMYPLLQGYDSVAVKADVEIGGTDQRFNLLAGRKLQRYYKQEPQDIITNPLIEGLDGRKMSSSWGNTINLLDSANEMFGKIMSLKDEYIIRYFSLATRVDSGEIARYANLLACGENPRNIKAKLGFEIVKIFHGQAQATRAQQEFDRIFKNKEAPDEIETFETNKKTYPVLDLLCDTGLAGSRNEARRLVEGSGVCVVESGKERKISDWSEGLNLASDMVIRAGKRKFVKIKIV